MVDDSEYTALRLRIVGYVQGVGFRAYAVHEAKKLELDGWVRNRSDRSVEALVSGSTKAVEAFAIACIRGPLGSRVDNVEMFRAAAPKEKGFNCRPTL